MRDDEIRKKYQREVDGDLGTNQIAIDRFIDMLNDHEKSDNEYVRTIIKNIDRLSDIAPNFVIFQSSKSTFFMHQFNALQIREKDDNDLVLSHEFGHAVLGAINHLQIPDNFEEIVKRCKSSLFES